jgi:hypothetical protein
MIIGLNVDQAMEENPQQRVGAGPTLRDGYPSRYTRHFAPSIHSRLER